jgi:hypothetical protein
MVGGGHPGMGTGFQMWRALMAAKRVLQGLVRALNQGWRSPWVSFVNQSVAAILKAANLGSA